MSLCGALAACGGGETKPEPPTASAVPANPTYYKDVKPIVDSRCAYCHQPNGNGPFPLTSYTEVKAQMDGIKDAVQSGDMPPWLPGAGCTTYVNDASLSDTQKSTLTNWIDQGAPEGDPKDYQAVPQLKLPTLSRVDATLKMPEAYTPQITPDDYRCFLLDWNETTVKYATGFAVEAGDLGELHHTIAFISPPSDVAMYQQMDANDPGPGWTCFGEPGDGNTLPAWLGAWAPGGVGGEFPAGTGIKIEPGSKIILQIHYNTLYNKPAPDQTSVQLELADSVQKEAAIVPWTNPQWLQNKQSMLIPAGAKETMHDFSFDPSLVPSVLSSISGGVITKAPFKIYSAGLHMHLHGTHIETDILQGGDSNKKECLVNIPRWDFGHQGIWEFTQPKTVNPGDSLYLRCDWDNTAANQPIVDGKPLPPRDLSWGDGTTDEMCLGIYYVTQN